MKTLLFAVGLAALLVVAAAAEDTVSDADFEPVHRKELMKLLPDGTKDFQAGKREGRMSGELGSKITIVSRVYTRKESASWSDWFADEPADEPGKETPKPTITIKITDSTSSKSFPALHNKLAEMGQSETSGFSNALSLDGHLAIQNYREKDQVGLLSVYAADRFLVQIAIKGLPKETMMEWWEKIDQEKLAALAVPPTPTPVPTPSHTPASSS
jgi:hypothetical protein